MSEEQKTPPKLDKPNGASKRELSRGPRIPKNFFLMAAILVSLVLVVHFATRSGGPTKTIGFTKFQEEYWKPNAESPDGGKYEGLQNAQISDGEIVAEIVPPKKAVEKEEPAKEEPPKKSWAESLTGASDVERVRVRVPPGLVNDAEFFQKLATIPNTDYRPTSNFWAMIAMPAIWTIIFILAFYLLLLRPLRGQGGPGGVLSFGRSRPKLVNKELTTVRFEDVAGADEAKEEVREVIEFLKNPEKFTEIGGRIPRGLLFVGPPGTGKTLLAKAIAGEADVPFYSISGSDFVEMFVGVGASRVRDLFRQAKENTPCIIFLDEVDAVGRRRGSGLGGGHDEREQTLNAILVEMDGFETNEQVIVIAATNRPDVLDPALLRPGRFDREIVINLPDLKGRMEILKVHSRHVKMSDKVDLEKIARGTPMFSGADLAALINEAAIHATMNGKKFIETEDLEEARDKVRFGRERRSRVLDEHDRRVTAYHEAGHAIITRLCPDAEPLHKVTIIPRGMSLGSTMYLPEKDRYTRTKRQLMAFIKIAFGGRIAEELFFDDISTGASNDIEQATDVARKMVCDFGMSEELGPIRYASKEQHVFLGGEISNPREFSEATAEQIDKAVRKIVDQCYADADEMIRANREDVELLSEALLKHETLSAEEVSKILNERSVDAVSKNGRKKAQANGHAAGAEPAKEASETSS